MDAMKARSLLRSESGSVAAIALILLMLLTVMGIAVSTTSTIGLRIAGNEKFYKQNLYLAEAAALEYAQEMEDDPDLQTNPNIKPQGSVTPDNIRDDTYWDQAAGNCFESSVENQPQVDPDDDPNIKVEYIPIYEGIAPGASLDMTKPTVHEYGIYARCKRIQGLAIVKVGYRKAY
jgi:hypothetical protein